MCRLAYYCSLTTGFIVFVDVTAQGKVVKPLPEYGPIFPGIPSTLAADITSVWMFFQLFGEPLHYPVIALDDFAHAVLYTGGDTSVITQVCVFMADSVGCDVVLVC